MKLALLKKNTTAKSKKALLILTSTITVIGILMLFSFENFMAIAGVVISLTIVAGLAFASYYLLKRFNELPDLFQ